MGETSERATTDSIPPTPVIPIVAIGASAGGLDAIRLLFGSMTDTTGMAFVVIQHLDARRPSMLTTVLSADLRMPVVEVSDGMRAESNRLHVIPPGCDLGIVGGILTVRPRRQTGKLYLPIDTFFRALAEDQASRGIGVVLSGTGSDGTEGLRAIEAAGGITFAQDPDSAQFRGMPESAIDAGVVNYRSSPENIARELTRLSRHAYFLAHKPGETTGDQRAEEDAGLARVLAAVRVHAQLDFSGYKRPTLMRRISRRMALRLLPSLDAYAAQIEEDALEAKAVAQDILIHVTSFFRDPGVFEALKRQVLPVIAKSKADGAALRVWAPGCATGEEAYSLAMCLLEFLGESGRSLAIKIFGSDLSEQAIETARAGVYPESALEGVSAARLARFFERFEGRYRLAKRVRDLCVFVRHDLTRDPPFAKLDIITCRNVLIYFDTDLQRRVVPLLHHCLNKPGFLLLGSSEAVTGFSAIFTPADKSHRIFARIGESVRVEYPLSLASEAEAKLTVFRAPPRQQAAREAQRQADHILMTRYAPPGVVVNEQLEIVQFRGRTGEYLEVPPGQPQTNILKMARGGLVRHLREALDAARSQSNTIRKEGVPISEDAQISTIDLEVIPLTGGVEDTDRFFLVLFEEPARERVIVRRSGAARRGKASVERAGVDEKTARLEAELAATWDYLQAIAGEHKDTTEELASANDEMVAANEELQSANEELQSAKEELQSTNEELTTLNDELRNRNQQLDVVASDLVNVLESVQIPVIMLDPGLRIRRFTPAARDVSNLLPGDVGRSIDDVRLKVRVDDLSERVRGVIASATPREWEVQGVDGRWFTMHVRPNRTADNRLDGATLSFLDVDVLKHALQAAERARDYAEGIVEAVPLSLMVLDARLGVVSVNPTFRRTLHELAPTAGRQSLFELEGAAWDVPALRQALDRCVSSYTPFRDLAVQCTFPGIGRRELLIAGSPLRSSQTEVQLLIGVADITERRTLEGSEQEARLEAERANSAKDVFLATLSHELRTPLSTILMSAQVLQMAASVDPHVLRSTAAIQRAVGQQVRLIDDLLDISRIVAGKLVMETAAVDLRTVVQVAAESAQAAADAKGIELHVDCEVQGAMRGDAARLQQVVANLLHNAVKFTPRGGQIRVRLEADELYARLTVADTGHGISAEMMPHVFERFVQADSAMTRTHGGLGLGLAIVRHLVMVHGGQVHGESPGEHRGSTFTVTLPLAPLDVAPSASAAVAPAPRIHGVRVLLIEDDDDTREACSITLERFGAEVRAERSAAAGLLAMEAFRPQVVLVDIAMPDEDGYSFIRKLRDREATLGRHTSAAALTALAGDEDRARALGAGFQMHLAKPVDATVLARAVVSLSEAGHPDGAAPPS